jgi:hypothetical protein
MSVRCIYALACVCDVLFVFKFGEGIYDPSNCGLLQGVGEPMVRTTQHTT